LYTSTRALLDTHAFIWFINGSERLSGYARELIETREHRTFISAASLWEIAIKHGRGKLALDRPFDELIPEQLNRQVSRLRRYGSRSATCRSLSCFRFITAIHSIG
jgi:PIN domain nuclease of toxin-antitoxin system